MERLKKVCLLCLFLSPSFLYPFSQSDSSYFPLALGNKWNYYKDILGTHSEMIVDTLQRN